MPIVKNLHLLVDLAPGQDDRLETLALHYWRGEAISFKVLEVSEHHLSIKIAQGKGTKATSGSGRKKQPRYLSKKELTAAAIEVFDHLRIRIFSWRPIRLSRALHQL